MLWHCFKHFYAFANQQCVWRHLCFCAVHPPHTLFIHSFSSVQILLPRSRERLEHYWEYSLALLKSLLDSRGQRSRSQQAVEMVKSSMSMLGCRSLSSSSSVDCDICKVIFVCTSRHQRHSALFRKSSHFTLKKFGYLMANQLNSGNWLLQWLWVSLCVLALRPIFSVWLVVSSFLVCTIGLKIFSTFSSL